MTIPGRLNDILKTMARDYPKVKSAAEACVERWEWATGRYYALLPYEQERQRRPKGKLLTTPPKAPKDHEQFGFDGQGRLCLNRKYEPNGKIGTEQFTEYDDGASVTRVYMNGGKEPGKVVQILEPGGRPSEAHVLGAEGDYIHERYQYKADSLEAIETEQIPASGRSIKSRLEFIYDPSGGGRAERVRADGSKATLFEFTAADRGSHARQAAASAGSPEPVGKPRKQEGGRTLDLKDLLKGFEEQLVQDVHETARKFKTARPAYCLAVNYGSDPCSSLIPSLGLGLLDEGETIGIPSGKIPRGKEWLWNPAEFSNFAKPPLILRSEKLQKLDRQLTELCREGKKIDIRSLCNSVAAKLNKMTWDPLPVSENFIVYAVDDDLADLEKNLHSAVTTLRNRRR